MRPPDTKASVSHRGCPETLFEDNSNRLKKTETKYLHKNMPLK
jgi:hypothetical protein